LRARSSVG